MPHYCPLPFVQKNGPNVVTALTVSLCGWRSHCIFMGKPIAIDNCPIGKPNCMSPGSPDPTHDMLPCCDLRGGHGKGE